MSEVRVGEWSGVENRRHKRVALKVPIECRAGETVRQGVAENISVSGILVRCQPFPQDSAVSVSFRLPGSSVTIRSEAQVAHVVPDIFMGLELVSLPADSSREIERFIASAVPVGKPK
jgi:hypothetical protein